MFPFVLLTFVICPICYGVKEPWENICDDCRKKEENDKRRGDGTRDKGNKEL